MDREEFQARIDDLETRLTDRQAEIEQLITEKSALKLKGMSGLSKQVEELGEMRHELRIAQERLDESHQDLERLPALEAMLADQQEKYQQLAFKYTVLKQDGAEDTASLHEELTAQRKKADELSEQLQTSLTAQNALHKELDEQRTGHEHEDDLHARNQNLEAELNDRHRECRHLQEKIEALLDREEGSSREQERKITSLSSQLEDMRQQNNQLNEQIITLTELKDELHIAQKGQRDIADMQQELTDMQEEMAALRENLITSQDEKQGLRQELTTISSQARRVEELEELLLARQVEVTNQNNKIEEIRAEHQKELTGLSRQLKELQQNLEDEQARRAEDEARLRELEEEMTAPVPVQPAPDEAKEVLRPEAEAEPVDQPAAAVKPPAETKAQSSPLLPDDILNKWLGG